MKTILVTGGNGLLGQKIIYALRENKSVRCISTSRGENRMKEKDGYIYETLELSDKENIKKIFEKYSPDAVINTAAMTNVDACETKREEAWQQNVVNVESLIDCCRQHHTHLVHLSTRSLFSMA
jgi:dTDP-4-dehydrorhamnose reductase